MVLREKNTDPKRENNMLKGVFKWQGYLISLVMVALATILGHFVYTFFAPTNLIMIYLLCVTISAVFCGLGPSIMTSILGVLAFDFFFVEPYLTFEVEDTQYIFTFIVLLLVGITISYLTSRIRKQTETAKLHEQETAILYSLSRELAISGDLESYIKTIVRRIKETLKNDVVIYLPDVNDNKSLKPYTGETNDILIDENDAIIASRFFQQVNKKDYRNDVYSDNKFRYMPLITARSTIGIMALRTPDVARGLTGEQDRLLRAYADLAAVAIEGILLADKLHEAQVFKATEKLQTALLNAISHDFRTPLVSVIGTLSSLQEEDIGLDDTAKKSLIQCAREEAERLNNLITNLLDESRIEAGVIKLSKQPAEVQDLVGAALEQLGSRVSVRPIKIDIPTETPFITVDFGLIVQTLKNIVDNAVKYSPPGSPIEIIAKQIQNELHIEIADHGIGIPEQDLPHIFEKFYRIKRPDNVAGTGLGLSISKGIIEAHGGSIKAMNNPGGGTIIKLILTLNELDSITRKNGDG